jgi:endoglucanase
MRTPAPSSQSPEPTWLRADGQRVVNGNGEPMLLKGFGLGGWLNMENFITGYGSSEVLLRHALHQILGDGIADRLIEGFLDVFFTEADASFLASTGVNSLRIPVNYRHLQDDLRSEVIRTDGFVRLDGAIRACAEQGIYSIIDLHAAPGGQNGHWHSDTLFHQPQLWHYENFQRRTVAIWQAIAERYRDEPWVAGYNLLNEPGSEDPRDLVSLYRTLVEAVREVDPRHMIFLDGNRFATEFPAFGEAIPNTVYAVHQYPPPCYFDAGPYPGEFKGQFYDRDMVERDFERLTAYIVEHDAPIWVGEFGPVYSGDPARDKMKRQLLVDQLDIYSARGAGWSLWTYKDMGMMGLVRAKSDSAWMQRTSEVRSKKALLGVDPGGSDDSAILDIMQPIRERLRREFPWYDPYPFGIDSHINRIVRGILFAEPLAYEFAQAFAGASGAEIDKAVSSFRFENCERNEDVLDIVSEACRA